MEPVELPTFGDPTRGSSRVQESLAWAERQLVGPGRRELVAKIRADVPTLGLHVVGVLRLGGPRSGFVFFGDADRVLIGVGGQHAPSDGKALFESNLKGVRTRADVVGGGADGSNLRHGGVVGTAEIGAQAVRAVGIARGGTDFEV